MKLNPDKCLSLSNGKEDKAINIGNVVIKNLHNEKLLGVFPGENTSF